MSEFAGFDLDRSTARAWSRFQVRLADHVAEMSDDDILIVSADDAGDDDADGAAPYVQFCAWGETLVRCEVSSNAYLGVDRRLDRAASEAVMGLGWAAPTVDSAADDAGEGSANFYVDVERSQADRLAVMTTRVLRDVFGVPHPAFLSSGRLDEDAPAEGPVPAEVVPEMPAVFPRDREHLQALVDEALTPYFGRPPTHDEDDDIPVVSGSALVFVRVVRKAPAVHLFCSLVHDVRDLQRATYEVTLLNRRHRFLKFVLFDDSVMAYVDIPAYPFAPEHLRQMLSLMSEAADELDDELARRVGARRTFEPDPDEAGAEDTEAVDVVLATDAVHPAMVALRELEAESPGSTTPELAASVCSMSRELILELIGWNTDQERAWRSAREKALLAGNDGEVEVCDRETSRAEATVNLLRRALRLVVEQQLGRDLEDMGYAVARRRSGPGRPRESDVALPGLDPATDEPDLFDQL